MLHADAPTPCEYAEDSFFFQPNGAFCVTQTRPRVKGTGATAGKRPQAPYREKDHEVHTSRGATILSLLRVHPWINPLCCFGRDAVHDGVAAGPSLRHTLDFPTWAHHEHPCFACGCTGGLGGNMAETIGLSVFALPLVQKDTGNYEAACAACEISVRDTRRDQHERFLGCRWFDNRPKGSAKPLPESILS